MNDHIQPRWLTVEDVRKQQRCRRTLVIAAMESGQLLYERRGRIRYARQQDVDRWEESRLNRTETTKIKVHPALADLLL